MTDEQLRRRQQVAAEAGVQDGSNIIHLPNVRQMAGAIERAALPCDSGMEAIGDPPPETSDICAVHGEPSDGRGICGSCGWEVAVMKAGIESSLSWHREHPGTDHLDAAFATAGFNAEVGQSRWPEFVTAVKDVTEASDAFRAAGLEAQR